MSGFTEETQAFAPNYLASLRKQILASRYLATNTLNRDFVGTRGFSVVFRRASLPRVTKEFPYFATYLERVMRPDCNAFYMNPLLLASGSRVDPHIDRSLSGYCPTVNPPVQVSVLYVTVPADMRGGRLELQRGRKLLGRVVPAENKLVRFDGDLMHDVERVESQGTRMSLVCEHYALNDEELEQIPEYVVETRARY
jgi:hypothetical protein